MVAMTIGELRRRVTITERVRVQDGQGGWTDQDKPVCTVWAKVTPKVYANTVYAVGDQLRSAQVYTLTIRYRSDIRMGQKASFSGQVMRISGVRDLNDKRRYQELTCDDVLL